jgi:hypothetical protein
MNHKAIIILLSLFFLGASARSETMEREFKVSPGKTLYVELETGGSITIIGWNKELVKVKGHIGGRDAKDCKVEMEEESGGIRMSSYYNGGKNHRSSDLDFEINVPNKFDLDLETMGGGITIDNVDGKMEGKTMGGKLNLSNLKGKLSLITMGGKITLTNSEVDGSVKTMGGEVLVQDVMGDIKATSQGGNVTQKNVKSRSGKGVGGEVNIKTMGGDINVDDAPEGADVHTMGGDIHIKRVVQSVRANTMGGDIEINAIDGRVDATTMGGDVNITMIGDPEKGDRMVKIESMGGDITLTVPAKLSMDIDITLAYTKDRDDDYKIVSDFAVKQEMTKEWEQDHGSARKYIYGTGMISGGKHKVRIKTVNGSVYLKKG